MRSRSLYLYSNLFNFLLVLNISFCIIKMSRTICSLFYFIFCLWNSFAVIMDLICMIYTDILSIIFIFVSCSYNHNSFYFPKPPSYVYILTTSSNIIVLFHSIPLLFSSTPTIPSIELLILPRSSSSSLCFLWSILAFWHSHYFPSPFFASFSHSFASCILHVLPTPFIFVEAIPIFLLLLWLT